MHQLREAEHSDGTEEDLLPDDTDFADFEDALQDLCAEQAECELIVTANIRDCAGHSRVEAVTPDELLKRIQ